MNLKPPHMQKIEKDEVIEPQTFAIIFDDNVISRDYSIGGRVFEWHHGYELELEGDRTLRYADTYNPTKLKEVLREDKAVTEWYHLVEVSKDENGTYT